MVWGVSNFLGGRVPLIFRVGLQFLGGSSKFFGGEGGVWSGPGGFFNFLGGVLHQNTVNVRLVCMLLECILVTWIDLKSGYWQLVKKVFN